jgi:uncharacterized protein with PQ loop repeat
MARVFRHVSGKAVADTTGGYSRVRMSGTQEQWMHDLPFDPNLIGWVATVVLLATLVRQIAKQAKDKSAEGVSTWLFVGQITASLLFVVYSALVGNVVFVVTNSLILLTAIVGQVIVSRNKRR